MKTNPALSALRHHVTEAIARGEAQAITEIPARPSEKKMKTKTYHSTNLGSARHTVRSCIDSEGYVTIHDDPRYDSMSRAQCEAELEAIAARAVAEGRTCVTEADRYDYVSAALLTRIAELDIAKAKGGEK